MSVTVPMCAYCSRWHGDRTCEAFPFGIPRVIPAGYIDHREPYDGDGGLVFEPVDQEAADLIESWFRDGPRRGPLPREEDFDY
jgi:hypothetical protein